MKKLTKVWNIAKPILNKTFIIKGYSVKVWYVLAAVIVVIILV